MSDVPTLKEEIERKALETLETIYLDREGGRITEAQYAYALTVLWGAVAGLASRDFTVMMEIADKGRKDGSFITHEYLRGRNGDIVRVSNLHDGQVHCGLISKDGTQHPAKVYDFREDANCIQAAKHKALALGDALVAKGFEEI